MADIFEEVDQGLAEERMRRRLRQSAPFAIGAVVVAVLTVATFQVFSAGKEARARVAALAYSDLGEAIAAKDVDGVSAASRVLQEQGRGGYIALGKMRQAEFLLEQGEPERAAELLRQAARAQSDALIADLAALKAAYLEADRMSYDELAALVAPIAQQGRPYQMLARELLAGAALADGRVEKARDDYQFLSFAPTAPEGVRRRAERALQLISAQYSERVETPADEEALLGLRPAETPAAGDEVSGETASPLEE